MDAQRSDLLRRLLDRSERHDRDEPDRLRRYRNITPDTGAFLSLWVRALAARRVLEIGTSNGYSTLWLADAVEPMGGRVTTIESNPGRAAEAKSEFAAAGLAECIELLCGRAQELLPKYDGSVFDLVFLDAERREYLELWPALERVVRRERGLLIVDNAISHALELRDFTRMLESHPRFQTCLVPVGKGEFLALSEVAA